MSFDIGGSKSSGSTSGRFSTLPKAPAWIEDPTKQLTQSIMALGNKPSSSYVAPTSPLQSAAFGMGANIAGRYGVAPQQQPMVMPGPAQPAPAPSSEGGLFASLGTSSMSTPDYAAYLQQNPDVASWASSAVKQPHFTKGAGLTAADYDADGSISNTEMARHHYETYGQGEGRVIPQTGGAPAPVASPQPVGQPQVVDMGGGQYRPTASAQPTVQAGPSQPGNNPLDNYRSAGLMAQIAGDAGPNRMTGATVGTARDVEGARMRSESLLRNLDDYMSPYTDDVVNTTLAGFDANAERLRAQQAAAAAGRGAFGGSRYAIGEAVTTGELARERAASEAGLRDRAFTTGATLSGQDADRRQQAGVANAQMEQQARLANQQSEIARILAQAGYDQQTGMFNAGQEDQSLDRQLQAAGLLTQIGATQQGQERADIGLVSDLGAQERDIQQQYSQADISSLSAITELLQQLGLANYIGQTGTESGKSKGSQFGVSASVGKK